MRWVAPESQRKRRNEGCRTERREQEGRERTPASQAALTRFADKRARTHRGRRATRKSGVVGIRGRQPEFGNNREPDAQPGSGDQPMRRAGAERDRSPAGPRRARPHAGRHARTPCLPRSRLRASPRPANRGRPSTPQRPKGGAVGGEAGAGTGPNPGLRTTNDVRGPGRRRPHAGETAHVRHGRAEEPGAERAIADRASGHRRKNPALLSKLGAGRETATERDAESGPGGLRRQSGTRGQARTETEGARLGRRPSRKRPATGRMQARDSATSRDSTTEGIHSDEPAGNHGPPPSRRPGEAKSEGTGRGRNRKRSGRRRAAPRYYARRGPGERPMARTGARNLAQRGPARQLSGGAHRDRRHATGRHRAAGGTWPAGSISQVEAPAPPTKGRRRASRGCGPHRRARTTPDKPVSAIGNRQRQKPAEAGIPTTGDGTNKHRTKRMQEKPQRTGGGTGKEDLSGRRAPPDGTNLHRAQEPTAAFGGGGRGGEGRRDSGQSHRPQEPTGESPSRWRTAMEYRR